MAMSAKDIVLLWIENRANGNNVMPAFWSYEFEEKIVIYGKLAHQKVHTASTYARAFRDIRSSDALSRFGFALEEIKEGKVKGWKINRL